MLPRFNDLDPETIALVEAALPRVGKELVAMIGLSAFLSLVDQFGGQEVVLPKSATGKASALYARWVETVGHDNYQAMLFNLGHLEKLAVPLCVRAEWVLRNREIVKKYEELTKRCPAPRQSVFWLVATESLRGRLKRSSMANREPAGLANMKAIFNRFSKRQNAG